MPPKLTQKEKKAQQKACNALAIEFDKLRNKHNEFYEKLECEYKEHERKCDFINMYCITDPKLPMIPLLKQDLHNVNTKNILSADIVILIDKAIDFSERIEKNFAEWDEIILIHEKNLDPFVKNTLDNERNYLQELRCSTKKSISDKNLSTTKVDFLNACEIGEKIKPIIEQKIENEQELQLIDNNITLINNSAGTFEQLDLL